MITLKNIQTARESIGDVIKETPIMTSGTLSSLCDNQLFLKAEHLQPTGSFKIRGATNKVKAVAQGGGRHVIAASSGNHGQAVAYIANKLGLKATIVVPEDATLVKVDAIKGYKAEVIYCGTTSQERIDKAKRLVEENGSETVYVPPYDDPLIMAGQGTVGLEILEQVTDVDLVYVPIGGGGLISGVLTAIKESLPKVRVVGVEPSLANDSYLSLKRQEIVTNPASVTIADGLRATQPGDLTFPVMQKYLDDIVLVSEDEIRQAFTFLLQRMKQLIEPSGAVTVAAAMSHSQQIHGKRIVAIASGGNMALNQIPQLIL